MLGTELVLSVHADRPSLLLALLVVPKNLVPFVLVGAACDCVEIDRL